MKALKIDFLCLQKLHLEMMKDRPRVTAYQMAIKEAVEFISGKVCCDHMVLV